MWVIVFIRLVVIICSNTVDVTPESEKILYFIKEEVISYFTFAENGMALLKVVMWLEGVITSKGLQFVSIAFGRGHQMGDFILNVTVCRDKKISETLLCLKSVIHA